MDHSPGVQHAHRRRQSNRQEESPLGVLPRRRGAAPQGARGRERHPTGPGRRPKKTDHRQEQQEVRVHVQVRAHRDDEGVGPVGAALPQRGTQGAQPRAVGPDERPQGEEAASVHERRGRPVAEGGEAGEQDTGGSEGEGVLERVEYGFV
ncbi:hypothetical protein GE09DRAFT_1123294 [Coniochaeta sp. 2T2.1]|nr:hypothetical protein GE09DRAFT_1123294 [Coniochaeta sp. 2T2.1]